jgi:hypothetical protein
LGYNEYKRNRMAAERQQAAAKGKPVSNSNVNRWLLYGGVLLGLRAEFYGMVHRHPFPIAILAIVAGFFTLMIVFWAFQKSRGKI